MQPCGGHHPHTEVHRSPERDARPPADAATADGLSSAADAAPTDSFGADSTPVPIYRFSIIGAEYGYLALSAAPGSICSATLTFPNNTTVKLPTKTAGADQKVDWTYPQPPQPAGSAHVIAVCALDGKSDSETTDFETVN